jgi:hypothetical protein
LLAAIAGIVPLSPELVERWFARGVYPVVQRTMTGVSNLVPVAVLDVSVAILLVLVFFSALRRARQYGWKKTMRPLLLTVLQIAAATYLIFLAAWGLNYRRVPLEDKLDFDRSRVSEQNATAFASEAIARVNAIHDAGHALEFDRGRLARSFAMAERLLGSSTTTRVGRPKLSLLQPYFRVAAIDGMTDPIFLEVIVNPDLVTIELPDVLAHEWAHLAGYADESEASFLAWLTCLRGDSLAQYSGWLSAYRRTSNVLRPQVRGQLPPLQPGPKADLRAIAERLGRSSRTVRDAARGAYDSYLKANRIQEGIENYDAVIQLMLGTSLGRDWSMNPAR